MATKQTAQFNALSNVFGTKPEGAIFLPSSPYQVRFNCQSGQLAISEAEFLGNKAEISILKVARFFGDLGKTRGEQWLQLFYVAAPGCTILPRDTVCCSYMKTRSLDQFQQVVTKLLADGANPATGIFTVSFKHHSNGDRNYYSVAWDWRERDGEAEAKQLEAIAAFMESGPNLIDTRTAASLVQIDGLSQEELELLVSTRTAAALPAAS